MEDISSADRSWRILNSSFAPGEKVRLAQTLKTRIVVILNL